MSSFKCDERGKTHPSGPRLREDVRFAAGDVNEEGPRHSEAPHRRGRGGGAPYVPPMLANSHSNGGGAKNGGHESGGSERTVQVTRGNKSLIVQVPNDHYHNPPHIGGRRGQPPNRSRMGPLRSSFRGGSYAPDMPGQNVQPPRGRSRSFREYGDSMASNLDWKPDSSGMPTDMRFQGGHRSNNNGGGGSGGRGMFSSAWASGDWTRSSGSRRGGAANGNGPRGGGGSGSNGLSSDMGIRMRRRGGAGDGSYRNIEDDGYANRDKPMGERPRGGGGPRRRGSIRRPRGGAPMGVRRGEGSWRRGNTDVRLQNKGESNSATPESDKPENQEENHSGDEENYRLNVDLKADNAVCALEVSSSSHETSTQEEGQQEANGVMIADGGLEVSEDGDAELEHFEDAKDTETLSTEPRDEVDSANDSVKHSEEDGSTDAESPKEAINDETASEADPAINENSTNQSSEEEDHEDGDETEHELAPEREENTIITQEPTKETSSTNEVPPHTETVKPEETENETPSIEADDSADVTTTAPTSDMPVNTLRQSNLESGAEDSFRSVTPNESKVVVEMEKAEGVESNLQKPQKQNTLKEEETNPGEVTQKHEEVSEE